MHRDTSFEFGTAGRVVFGPGSVRGLPDALRAFGRRFLLVTGRAAARVESLVEALESAGLKLCRVTVAGEPTVEGVVTGAAVGREASVEGVVGLGGGSVLDGAKAMAAFLTNGGDPVRYLEVIGEGRPLEHAPLPFVAVPTTAGTGAEVTRNAVLASPSHRVKVSLRSPSMMARLAVVDPELTYGLSPTVTAATGLDALTQLIEPFVSCRANPMTDAICREGIPRVARALRVAYGAAGRVAAGAAVAELTASEREARSDMALAAMFSGLALANAGLGAVHGFAGPLGGMFAAPHGAVCAALLPPVMEVNLHALRAREPAHPVLGRFDEIGVLLTGRREAVAEEGIAWVRDVTRDLGIPGLAAYGVSGEQVGELVDKASRASSMRANPIALRPEELAGILVKAM